MCHNCNTLFMKIHFPHRQIEQFVTKALISPMCTGFVVKLTLTSKALTIKHHQMDVEG